MLQTRHALWLLATVAGTAVASGQDTKPAAPVPPAATHTAPSSSATNRSARPGPFSAQADARKDLAAALAKARKDGKRVLLDFGANWCPDCLVLVKRLEDPAVRPFLEAHFHLVKVNIGSHDQNLDLVQEYGNPIEKGIPAVVVLDARGKVLATTRGGELANARTSTPEEILAFLKQWAPKKP